MSASSHDSHAALPDGVGVISGLPVGHPMAIRRSSNTTATADSGTPTTELNTIKNPTSAGAAGAYPQTARPRPPPPNNSSTSTHTTSSTAASATSSSSTAPFKRNPQTVAAAAATATATSKRSNTNTIAHTNAELADRLTSIKSVDTTGVNLFQAVAREIPDCGAPLHSLLYTYRNIAPNNVDAMAKGSEGMLADLKTRMSAWETSQKQAMTEEAIAADKDRERKGDESRRVLIQRAEQVDTRISRMNDIFNELDEKIEGGGAPTSPTHSSYLRLRSSSTSSLGDADRHSLEARRKLLEEAKKKAEIRAEKGRQAAVEYAASVEKITQSRIKSEREMDQRAIQSNFVIEEHLKRCAVRNEENRARIRIAVVAADSMQAVKLVQEGYASKETMKAQAMAPWPEWQERLTALWKPYQEWVDGIAALRTAHMNYLEMNELHTRALEEATERSTRLLRLKEMIRVTGNHPATALPGIEAFRGALHRHAAECEEDGAAAITEADARRLEAEDALRGRIHALEESSLARRLTKALRADLITDERRRRTAHIALDRVLELDVPLSAASMAIVNSSSSSSNQRDQTSSNGTIAEQQQQAASPVTSDTPPADGSGKNNSSDAGAASDSSGTADAKSSPTAEKQDEKKEVEVEEKKVPSEGTSPATEASAEEGPKHEEEKGSSTPTGVTKEEEKTDEVKKEKAAEEETEKKPQEGSPAAPTPPAPAADEEQQKQQQQQQQQSEPQPSSTTPATANATSSSSSSASSSSATSSSSSSSSPQTLREVSEKYQCTIADIKAVNPELADLDSEAALPKGTKLKLPKNSSNNNNITPSSSSSSLTSSTSGGGGGATATKSSAKTLQDVSEQYKFTVDEIKAANPALVELTASDSLPKGTKLVLPKRRKSKVESSSSS